MKAAQPSVAATDFPLLAVGIDDPDQLDAGHLRENARMVAAHDADADDADFQGTVAATLTASAM